MTPRAFLALPLALALCACSNPKAASEANFKAAIQTQLASQRACFEVLSGFPRELVEGRFFAYAELFEELAALGLLEAEPFRKEARALGGGARIVEGKRYSLTEAGQAAVGRANALVTSFCYGSYRVREVTNFTEPGQVGGRTASTASYTYSADGIVAWARDSEILRERFPRLARDLVSGAEPIKGQAALVLTQNGWMHAAMFGK